LLHIEHEETEAAPVRSTLVEGLDVLRRRIAIVLACTLAAGALAAALSLTATKQYTATSALLFRATSEPSAAQALFGQASQNSSSKLDPAVEQATNVQLVDLRTVDALTAAAMGHAVSPDRVRQSVSVTASGQANVVLISATTARPSLSAALANTFAAQFVRFRQQIDSAAIVAAEARVRQLLASLSPSQQTGPAARSLQSQAQDLSLVASLQSGNAQVVQTATTPTTPSSPKKIRDTVIGLLVGLIVGVLVAFAVERFDRRLRSVAEMSSILGRPVIGAVPSSRAFTGRSKKLTTVEIEAFQLLRANLQHFKSASGKTDVILITSAQPGDGKSTVSTFLAAATAVVGGRVVLIDADFRHPGRYVEPIGLTQVLAGRAPLTDVIVSVPAPLRAVDSDVTMDVVPTGPLRSLPIDYLSAEALENVVAYCRSHYDLVLVDAPPLTVVSDAVPLTQLVSGVLVVARMDQTERLQLRRLAERLNLLGANVIGLVANAVDRRGADGYGYAYGYSDTASTDTYGGPNGASRGTRRDVDRPMREAAEAGSQGVRESS
jgi:polysaccharide biosynthesis transport protein